MKKWVLMPILMLLSILSMNAQDQGIKFIENKTWQQLLDLSAKQDKLIFLDCYTTWCGPCKAMAKDVFPLPEVGAFMNPRFINVKLDMEKGEGIELNKKYQKYIPGFPTYLLINAKGEVVHQVAGYNAADKFIAKIKDGLQERSWVVYTEKYDAGQRDWPFMQTYLSLLEDAYQSAKIKQVSEEALPRLSVSVISADSSAYRIFRKYWQDAESPMLAHVLASPGLYRKYKDPEKEINEWGGRVYKRAVDGYVQTSLNTPKVFDTVKANTMITTLRNLNVNGKENMIAMLLLSKAAVAKDGDRFLTIYHAGKEFGLLKYDKRFTSKWFRNLAEHTTNKVKLKAYLAGAQVDEADTMLSGDEIRNYAFILEKLGDKAKAKEYHAKAEKIEEALKEKYRAFMNSKN